MIEVINSRDNDYLAAVRAALAVGFEPIDAYPTGLDIAREAARTCQDAPRCVPTGSYLSAEGEHTPLCIESGNMAAAAVPVLERLVNLAEIAEADEEEALEERMAAEAERMFALYQGDTRRARFVEEPDQSLAYDKGDPKRETALGWEG